MLVYDEQKDGGIMLSALDHEKSSPGSSPGQGHCAVLLANTLYSHIDTLHQVCKWLPGNLTLRVNLALE